MNTLRTTLTVLAVLVLAASIFFAGSMFAHFNTFGMGGMAFAPGANAGVNGFGWNNTYGPAGMMGGNGYYGPGMMNGRNNYYGHGGMMGRNGYNNTNATPLTVDQAKTAAQKYLDTLNNTDLKIAEVMIFNNNAYIVVKEASTGNGAFELLVDSDSQVAYPEYGPNMMWNLKYAALNHQYMMGNSGGMMNGWYANNTTPANISADMPVSQEQAIKAAQAFLDQNISGATAATDPVKFYGYYTLDFEKDGKVAGMLSVNGYNEQVFLHTWHGTFIEESEIE